MTDVKKPTVNESLLDLSIDRHVDAGRWANTLVNRVLGLLNDADDDIEAKIRKWDKAGLPRSVARREALLLSLRKLHAEIYSGVYGEMLDELMIFGGHEMESTATMLDKAIPVKTDFTTPSIEQLKVLVEDTPVGGTLLKEWWASIEASQVTKTAQQLRIGMAEGESTDQLIRRLIGSAKSYEPGIYTKVRQQTEPIVRTFANHVSNQAAMATYSANSDVIKGVQWVLTLDIRTCLYCVRNAQGGKIYALNEGPRPPVHLGDRCFMAPVLKSWQEMGIPGLKELPPSVRASMDGVVPEATTYPNWLKMFPHRSPEAFGPTRAKLFTKGELKIEAYFDNKGLLYDIPILKERNAVAFARAFP